MVTKLLTVLLLSLISPSFCGNVGIGFSTSGPYDVPLGQMKSKNVYILKTWDIQADLLNQMEITYAQDNLDVTVAVPNSKLSAVVYNDQAYLNFVRDQLVKHKRIIKLIAVGNEPFLPENRAVAMPHILNAFNRIVKLVNDNGLASSIKVTIPFSAAVLTNTYPVSNAVFHPDVISLMRSVTPTMMSTGSKFSINLYPYFGYAYSSQISLAFALGSSGSLLDADLQACRNALNKIGANALPLIVGETGWPSAGGKDTNVANMQTYIQNTVNYARSNQLAQTIYIFDAYDESWKPAGIEQHWGLYTEGSRTPKFNFDIASYGSGGGGGGGGSGGGGNIDWKGNWAFACDFKAGDIGNAQVPGAQCSSKCASTPRCTHYAWTTYNGGTCWMKSGAVSKSDAFATIDQTMVCGLL